MTGEPGTARLSIPPQCGPSEVVRLPLTPLDIHNKEFRKGFRGYSEEEVDDFLDEVVQDFDNYLKENARLRDEVAGLRERLASFQRLEETLNNTLLVAQRTAEEVRENAQKEAELIIKDAEARAEKIIAHATEKIRRLAYEYEDTRKQLHLFRTRFKTMVQAQLEALEEGVQEAEKLCAESPLWALPDGAQHEERQD